MSRGERAVQGLEEEGIDRGMERRDVGMVGIAPAGEPGLEVEVDELGRDAVCELQFPLPCLGYHPPTPLRMHLVDLAGLRQLTRPAKPGIKPRRLQNSLPIRNPEPALRTRRSPRRRRPSGEAVLVLPA